MFSEAKLIYVIKQKDAVHEHVSCCQQNIPLWLNPVAKWQQEVKNSIDTKQVGMRLLISVAVFPRVFTRKTYIFQHCKFDG